MKRVLRVGAGRGAQPRSSEFADIAPALGLGVNVANASAWARFRVDAGPRS